MKNLRPFRGPVMADAGKRLSTHPHPPPELDEDRQILMVSQPGRFP